MTLSDVPWSLGLVLAVMGCWGVAHLYRRLQFETVDRRYWEAESRNWERKYNDLALAQLHTTWVTEAPARVPPCDLRTPPTTAQVLTEVLEELDRATTKFPTWPTDPHHALNVLGEEYGELEKAVVQATYEPHKSGPEDVRKEAVQTAAMALRFVMSLERYEYAPCPQHAQAPLRPEGLADELAEQTKLRVFEAGFREGDASRRYIVARWIAHTNSEYRPKFERDCEPGGPWEHQHRAFAGLEKAKGKG